MLSYPPSLLLLMSLVIRWISFCFLLLFSTWFSKSQCNCPLIRFFFLWSQLYSLQLSFSFHSIRSFFPHFSRTFRNLILSAFPNCWPSISRWTLFFLPPLVTLFLCYFRSLSFSNDLLFLLWHRRNSVSSSELYTPRRHLRRFEHRWRRSRSPVSWSSYTWSCSAHRSALSAAKKS